jgi:hypothetical protein
MEVKNFESCEEVQYEKKDIGDILNESELIDTEAAATEILIWIANNVEQFIDNQRKMFKLDLIIDAEDGATETMPCTRALQNLYRAIPDDPEVEIESIDSLESAYANLSEKEKNRLDIIQNCRTTLDNVANAIQEDMRSNQEMLEALFKRMGFYYEMKGVNQGSLLVEELVGEVAINKFEYEAFPVGVNITNPVVEVHEEDGSITESGGDVQTSYVIPEGFTVWLEIAFKAKQQQMGSLF